MHKVGVTQEEPRRNMGSSCIWIDLRIRWVLDRLGDVQPTTGNCYLAVISTVFVNHIALLLRTSPLATLRVSFVLRLRQSFPEDCARLKLSSARASQAGLKEMMTRRRVRAVVTSNPGKRRPPVLLVQREAIRRGEITNPALMLSY